MTGRPYPLHLSALINTAHLIRVVPLERKEEDKRRRSSLTPSLKSSHLVRATGGDLPNLIGSLTAFHWPRRHPTPQAAGRNKKKKKSCIKSQPLSSLNPMHGPVKPLILRTVTFY